MKVVYHVDSNLFTFNKRECHGLYHAVFNKKMEFLGWYPIERLVNVNDDDEYDDWVFSGIGMDAPEKMPSGSAKRLIGYEKDGIGCVFTGEMEISRQ